MFAVQALTLIFVLGAASGYGNWNQTHICCDGSTVWERDARSSVYCCGTQTYDAESQICCGTTLTDRPAANSSSYYGCCLNEETGEQTPFDYSLFQCCKTKIVEKPDTDTYYSCCGNELYRYSESLCCGEQIIARGDSQECCGEEMPYNSTTQLCAAEYDMESRQMSYTLMAIDNNHTEVCKKQLYDTHTQACCSGEVVQKDESLRDVLYPGCCGTGASIKTYDYGTHVCCYSTGELLPIPADKAEGVWPECCAGEVFTNYTWQGCCNDQIIDRPAKYQGNCCGSQMLTNYSSQFCCGDIIYERVEGVQLSCCSDTIYDRNSQYCCGDALFDVDVKFAGCCYAGRNATTYDRRTAECGENGVQELHPYEIEKRKMLVNASDALCVQSGPFY